MTVSLNVKKGDKMNEEKFEIVLEIKQKIDQIKAGRKYFEKCIEDMVLSNGKFSRFVFKDSDNYDVLIKKIKSLLISMYDEEKLSRLEEEFKSL